MKQYTINLSRARAAGRRKRARKAVSVLKEELERKEGDVILSREVNQEIWKRGASKPPAKVSVRIEEEDGKKKVYPAEERTSSEASGSRKDFSEVLSGTVGEAKDAIEDMEEPDYNALLEAEKDGKDRKTLKDWLEAQA